MSSHNQNLNHNLNYKSNHNLNQNSSNKDSCIYSFYDIYFDTQGIIGLNLEELEDTLRSQNAKSYSSVCHVIAHDGQINSLKVINNQSEYTIEPVIVDTHLIIKAFQYFMSDTEESKELKQKIKDLIVNPSISDTFDLESSKEDHNIKLKNIKMIDITRDENKMISYSISIMFSLFNILSNELNIAPFSEELIISINLSQSKWKPLFISYWKVWCFILKVDEEDKQKLEEILFDSKARLISNELSEVSENDQDDQSIQSIKEIFNPAIIRNIKDLNLNQDTKTNVLNEVKQLKTIKELNNEAEDALQDTEELERIKRDIFTEGGREIPLFFEMITTMKDLADNIPNLKVAKTGLKIVEIKEEDNKQNVSLEGNLSNERNIETQGTNMSNVSERIKTDDVTKRENKTEESMKNEEVQVVQEGQEDEKSQKHQKAQEVEKVQKAQNSQGILENEEVQKNTKEHYKLNVNSEEQNKLHPSSKSRVDTIEQKENKKINVDELNSILTRKNKVFDNMKRILNDESDTESSTEVEVKTKKKNSKFMSNKDYTNENMYNKETKDQNQLKIGETILKNFVNEESSSSTNRDDVMNNLKTNNLKTSHVMNDNENNLKKDIKDQSKHQSKNIINQDLNEYENKDRELEENKTDIFVLTKRIEKLENQVLNLSEIVKKLVKVLTSK